jgi:hypothetical protein
MNAIKCLNIMRGQKTMSGACDGRPRHTHWDTDAEYDVGSSPRRDCSSRVAMMMCPTLWGAGEGVGSLGCERVCSSVRGIQFRTY